MEKIVAILGAIIGIFTFGFLKGKSSVERKNLKRTLDEVAMAKQIEEANMALSRDELIDGLQEQDKSD